MTVTVNVSMIEEAVIVEACTEVPVDVTAHGTTVTTIAAVLTIAVSTSAAIAVSTTEGTTGTIVVVVTSAATVTTRVTGVPRRCTCTL